MCYKLRQMLKSPSQKVYKYKIYQWKIKKCPKKIESFYWNLDFDIALAPWCAASGLKMEVIFIISIKKYIYPEIFSSFEAVLNQIGTPYCIGIPF